MVLWIEADKKIIFPMCAKENFHKTSKSNLELEIWQDCLNDEQGVEEMEILLKRSKEIWQVGWASTGQLSCLRPAVALRQNVLQATGLQMVDIWPIDNVRVVVKYRVMDRDWGSQRDGKSSKKGYQSVSKDKPGQGTVQTANSIGLNPNITENEDETKTKKELDKAEKDGYESYRLS